MRWCTRRLSRLGLLSAIVAAGACSLLNAPEDVIGGGGGGGQPTTSASTTSSTTISSITGTGGGSACRVDADCSGSPSVCHRFACASGGTCEQVPLPDATLCDDGNFCTVGDTCQAGFCTGLQRSCPPRDACNVGACDEQAQACAFAVGTDGVSCDDGNPCDNPGTCKSGTCQQGSDACAALQTDCLDATCMAGVGCVTQPKSNGTSCGVTYCSTGLCNGGHCDITAVNEGKTCNDGLYCTINETCQSGYCVGVPNPCPAAAQCVESTCDEATKSCPMTAIPDNSPCNDGNACHAGAYCSNQVCTGGQAPTAVLTETFDDNSHGWTLGAEWQIGRATSSHGQTFGNPDPGYDHTQNAASGVAGVEIGGNAAVAFPNPTHPSYYLTSPAIDTHALQAVYLTYYRWLNSDYAPYMTNTVEASTDGVTWSVVWTTADVPITDSSWTFQSLDVSAFKGPKTQIRFGFSIGVADVYTVSSWNIDDVKVQNAPCPN